MKKISVLIVSDDRDYTENVSAYFKNHYSDHIMLVCCDNADNVSDYINNNNISIILCEPQFRQSAGEAAAGKCAVFVLVEKNGSVEERTAAKYISAPSLYRKLASVSADFEAGRILPEMPHETAIFSFVSAGGCGATVLAAAFSKYLTDHNKTVLFLGLDNVSDYTSALPQALVTGVKQIAQTYLSGTDAKNLISGKIHLIHGGEPYDLSSVLDESQVYDMIEGLTTDSGYDYAIIDFSAFDNALWAFSASKAKNIVAVAENTAWEISKLNKIIGMAKTKNQGAEKISAALNKSRMPVPEGKISCGKLYFISEYYSRDMAELISDLSHERIWAELIG